MTPNPEPLTAEVPASVDPTTERLIRAVDDTGVAGHPRGVDHPTDGTHPTHGTSTVRHRVSAPRSLYVRMAKPVTDRLIALVLLLLLGPLLFWACWPSA